MSTTSVVICGVGGQGILLASEILSDLALAEGLDVKKSEIHGMAQRGGSVVSMVRFGEKVYSPIVPREGGDYILAFELIEAVRWMDYLKEDGTVIVNEQRIMPMTVITGQAEYPADTDELLEQRGRLQRVKALEKAMELGTPRCVNVILLGVLSKSLPFSEASWLKAIRERVKPAYVELNEKAFAEGRAMAG